MQDIRAVISSELESVDQLIVEQLHSDVPLVEDIGHYIVEAGGKRMRPTLVLLAAKALGYDGRLSIQLATAIEYIHTATLLHDDVVDISMLRRGRPTANAQWGNAPSVLVGDFIYSRAFQMLVAMNDMPIMALLATTTNKIAEGEVLQLQKAGDPTTTEEEYLTVIKNKTAILFEASSLGGAMIAGASPTQCEALRTFGSALGTAFQLIDDVLDYQGKAEEMGKNIGDDLAEGKPTLPLIYTMRQNNQEQATIVEQAIRNKSSEQLSQIIEAVSSNGALEYTHSCAVKEQERAIRALEHLPDNEATRQMARLAHLAVNRRA
ncbi:octaprenyl-diphosphate synthase [Sinobacterium caligoides]|uniref:Octaprenyl diphosphate synthase n=1 Tax=Sinobacterium caligoides TaxID=933926 RepID=A0A3N2D599_9GAMM|nr:polyprenyl synthetase family protein [Sinobacterium caligoides]ROR94852.1 octaprenyl-diphosphate synthase [Sinobacterium caligoides]